MLPPLPRAAIKVEVASQRASIHREAEALRRQLEEQARREHLAQRVPLGSSLGLRAGRQTWGSQAQGNFPFHASVCVMVRDEVKRETTYRFTSPSHGARRNQPGDNYREPLTVPLSAAGRAGAAAAPCAAGPASER